MSASVSVSRGGDSILCAAVSCTAVDRSENSPRVATSLENSCRNGDSASNLSITRLSDVKDPCLSESTR